MCRFDVSMHWTVTMSIQNYIQIQRTKLAENIRNSDTFWGELRKINPVSKQISETIVYRHCSRVF